MDVGLTEQWDPSLGDFLNEIYQYQPKNLDHNSGNPLGTSICQIGARNGCRVNAFEAFLSSHLPNLTVKSHATVTKVLFGNRCATEVEVGGETSIGLPPSTNNRELALP